MRNVLPAISSLIALSAAASGAPMSATVCESVERLPSMGTVFEMQLVAPCEAGRREALVLAALKRLDTIEASMSLYQKESEISRLNRGEALSPSYDFRRVIEASILHGERTEGYFDITVWPALSAIQKTIRETGRPPGDGTLRRLRKSVDFRNIELGPDSLRFKREGTQITTDGIAKGYAVDEVAVLLDQLGVEAYLLNFSGNMRLKGAHLDGRPWSVAILNPVDRGTIPAAISSGEAIASSGVDYASFTKDKRWHHIIDPTTLKPANHVVGSTVIGPSAATCDVLSTAVFVMGPSRTREIMARHYPQYRYWMVDAGNRVTTNIKTENPKGKPRT